MSNKLKIENIVKYLHLIGLNYENAYRINDDEDNETLINFWYDNLKRYDEDIVTKAVYNTIKNNEFTPRLSNIIKEIRRLQEANSPSDEQLWAELTNILGQVYQVSRYLSYPQYSQWTDAQLNKLYDSLSEELKLFVVNRSTLVDISEMTDENLQYERARFFKQMPTLRQHYYDSIEAKEFLYSNSNDTLKQIESKKHS